ncbi:hypothetical protein [Paraburkholderia caribensis]|nr:hypothetical protein [Paraburkholderia caribensis]
MQPLVMNVFSPDVHPNASGIQSPANPLEGDENSVLMRIVASAEELSKTQDRRIATDLNSRTGNQSSTARLLNLLQLQYDLDDMQISATLAKNIAEKVSQAITTLTQRN